MKTLRLAAILLMALAATSSWSLAQEAAVGPIPANVATFLQDLFAKVPAPSIAASITQTTCRKDFFDEPFEGVGSAEVMGAYVCQIDFGCGQVDSAPVWFDANDTLWFGPDSVDRLVAMYCAESISDPERRKTLSASVQQGG